jgi:hypothetical protein
MPESECRSNGSSLCDYSCSVHIIPTPPAPARWAAFSRGSLDLDSLLSTSDSDARPYTITDDPFSNSYSLSDAEQACVQSVFGANFNTLDVTNGEEAAGFQVALWNALYEGDLLAQSGRFAVSTTQAVINKANYYLGEAAADDTNENIYRMSFLESTPGDNEIKRQNLVTVSPVPLPAAGILLLVALGGLGVAGRRRKSA